MPGCQLAARLTRLHSFGGEGNTSKHTSPPSGNGGEAALDVAQDAVAQVAEGEPMPRLLSSPSSSTSMSQAMMSTSWMAAPSTTTAVTGWAAPATSASMALAEQLAVGEEERCCETVDQQAGDGHGLGPVPQVAPFAVGRAAEHGVGRESQRRAAAAPARTPRQQDAFHDA